MAEKNEIKVAFSEQLEDKLLSVVDALPNDLNPKRFTQNFIAVANEKPELLKVNRAEVIQGALKGAYLGLDFMNKECYLIPYGNTVQFQTSYIGEKKFVKKYAIRQIKDIYAKVVRDGDGYEEKIIDGHPSIDFNPKPFNDGSIVGAFAVVLYEDGGMEYESMSAKDIEGVRASFSKAKNGKAWTTNATVGEMYKKTVLRRLCKHIETDFETVEAKKAWDDGSDMDVATKPINTDIVTNPFEVVEDDGSITIEES